MIYIGKKKGKEWGVEARIRVLVGKRRKIAGKEIFLKKKLSARIGKSRGKKEYSFGGFGDCLEKKTQRERLAAGILISLEAEQYSSKIGSSRYGHTKFASSHPYMILNIILQVRVLSY